MKEYRQQFFKGERALFAEDGAKIYDSIFDDGESPLKESKNIEVYNSQFKWKYPMWYSENIEVVYHMMKRQKPPISSREAKRKDVDDITWEFSHAGFVNIERIAISDLIKGWLVKEDSVEKVEINGKSDYRKKDKIRIDAAVVVYYHTFKNKNHQD